MKFEVIKYRGKYGVQRVMATDYYNNEAEEFKSAIIDCSLFNELWKARKLKQMLEEKTDNTIQIIPDDHSYSSLTPEDYHECG
jgi:hypothetical protein